MKESSPTHPVLAAGVVLWSGVPAAPRFLILRNALHQSWGLPKGHLEIDESLVDGALREVAEETGIPLTAADLREDFADTSLYQPRPGVYKRVIYFLAADAVAEESLQRSPEHDQHLWCEVDEAMQHLAHDALRRTLRRAAQRLALQPEAAC